MEITNEQYNAFNKLQKWYNKYNHQVIDISATVGTGIWELLQYFFDLNDIERREVMYLSYDQKQVIELAYMQYHAYYLDRVIHKYTRIVDLDTIPVFNSRSTGPVESTWIQHNKHKINKSYNIIVVFDSILLNKDSLERILDFGLPVILIRDPMLIPLPDSALFDKEPNIELLHVTPLYAKNPIVHFAYKVLAGDKIPEGNFDAVNVVPKRSMNIYNLKSSDMNLTLDDRLMNQTNRIYREKVLKQKGDRNYLGERLIVDQSAYRERLENESEKRIKVYLDKGVVGKITKINRHVPRTKYINIDFMTDFYGEPFVDLIIDRHYLNNIDFNSRQIEPDEICYFKYAYALSIIKGRIGHWDKVTLILDDIDVDDIEIERRLIYSAIVKAKKSLIIIK